MRHRIPAQSLAGIEGLSITQWSAKQDQVSFLLYRSPDAGHQVTARLRGDTLRGQGRSWEDMRADGFSGDEVTAIRVGPPNPSICVKQQSQE
jgi:hypothetical protein